MGEISREARRLIDEAVAEGRVTKIPRGVSAYEDETYYDPKEGKIKYRDPVVAKRRLQVRRAPDRGVALRRKRVAVMAGEGKTCIEVAKELGISYNVARTDAMIAGVTFRRDSTMGRKLGITPETKALREKIRAAYDGVKTAQEIADIVGLKRKTILNHLKAMNLKTPLRRPDVKAVVERRAKVKDLVAQGMTGQQIADQLGIKRSTVHLDCQKLGIRIKRKGARS